MADTLQLYYVAVRWQKSAGNRVLQQLYTSGFVVEDYRPEGVHFLVKESDQDFFRECLAEFSLTYRRVLPDSV